VGAEPGRAAGAGPAGEEPPARSAPGNAACCRLRGRRARFRH
jgi:hypothetical protein